MNATIYPPIASSSSPAAPRPVLCSDFPPPWPARMAIIRSSSCNAVPIRHRVDAKQQADARPFTHQVIVRPTGLRSMADADPDRRVEYQNLCEEIIRSERRNAMIRDDVVTALHEGRSPLVLTERTEHVATLADLIRPHTPHLIILQGGMGRKSLREAIAQLAAIPENEPRVVIATGKFVGEGFDDSRLDTLFLTMPVSWRGIIAQYAGRLHRLHDGKREVRVHDYADLDIPMLSRMFDKRCAGYEAVGYTILLPASALPGWPSEVPLPIDPAWKKDYAASVRRLIRDGVDAPLGNLFVTATRANNDHDRARSASEAFLFHRLESLPETTGLFRLNAKLPIPFDGWSEMEIDLFCAGSQARHRDRRSAAPRRPGGLSPRPAQGRVAPGKRLPCPPISSRRPRQTSGCHARRHPPRHHAPSEEAIDISALNRHYVDSVPVLDGWPTAFQLLASQLPAARHRGVFLWRIRSHPG